MKNTLLKQLAKEALRPKFEENTKVAFEELMDENQVAKEIRATPRLQAIVNDAVEDQLESETDEFLSRYEDLKESNVKDYATQYFKEEIDITFSYVYLEDRIDLEQLKKERKEMVNVELAREEMYNLLEEKLESAYQDYMAQNKMPAYISDASKYHDVVRKVAQKQTDLGVDEFLDEYVGMPDEDMKDSLIEYVQENYDHDFLYFNIEQELNYEAMKIDLVDDLVLGLENTEPYGNAPTEYWKEKANSVQSVSELASYGWEQNYAPFIETYAPDWQEVVED